jgi:hypothetical protein
VTEQLPRHSSTVAHGWAGGVAALYGSGPGVGLSFSSRPLAALKPNMWRSFHGCSLRCVDFPVLLITHTDLPWRL